MYMGKLCTIDMHEYVERVYHTPSILCLDKNKQNHWMRVKQEYHGYRAQISIMKRHRTMSDERHHRPATNEGATSVAGGALVRWTCHCCMFGCSWFTWTG